MKPGDAVVWKHWPRGGYGFVAKHAATVVRMTTKTAVIRLGSGEEVRVRLATLELRS